MSRNTRPHVRPLLCAATAAAALAACEPRPPEFGVSVFADDTVTVAFTVSLSGSLVMGLRSDVYQMRPDKSLLMTTPAELIIQRGAGTAVIKSLRGGRLVVQPLGAGPDSTATASAEGLVVRVERRGEERTVKLLVEKP